ncbi:aldo/keto reductase [Embleya sp. NBC_00896]|uniref:aldo/keto reductase n=1 Tax=Embleya sp. NBC_00896 TaxID=2975961 RepID=UPI002F9141E4|nr:aldo/keto reductase [Embleya sp. NBC_00896]
MPYTRLGRTGLTVSRLVLGTMNFGAITDEQDSGEIMDAALDAGINFFDTADVYGHDRQRDWGTKGATEEIVGRWLGRAGHRDKVVLATKVYGNWGDWPNSGGLSARHIRTACEDSLRRLGTDHIDLYQMHHIDRRVPWEEIWQAMDLLVAQGKVLYVGSSNFAGWHIARAQEAAARRSSLGLVAEQCLYNLAQRAAEAEVLPAAQAYGLGVITWSPLYGGLLGGVLAKERAGDRHRSATGRAASELARRREQIQAYEQLCAELGTPPGDVALAWLLTRPEVTAPIVGPRTRAQLDAALRAVRVELEDATLAELDRLFPGQGAAPESFAW